MNNVSEQIEALNGFKQAYIRLQFMWDGRGKGTNLNDTDAVRDYPFHKSFDELNVRNWVDRTVAELRSSVVMRNEKGLSSTEINSISRIISKFNEEIDFLSVKEVENLQQSLKYLAYNKDIEEFYQHLLDSMPDMPNSTVEEQEAFDEAWEEFYETPFIISFGGRTVKINNEATIYQGIVDTLKEMIDNCL